MEVAALRSQIAALKNGKDGTPGRDGVSGKDGKPWTVDVVLTWDDGTPITKVSVPPPKTGSKQIITVPLKKESSTPQ